MQGPWRVRWRRKPRHRCAQRIVDLEGSRVTSKARHTDPDPWWQFVEGDQTTIEVLGCNIGQHCPADPHKLIMRLYAARTPVLDDDLGHLRVAFHRTSVRDETITHCLREPASAAFRDWKPDRLAEHDQ
jgi:hypothetical protein